MYPKIPRKESKAVHKDNGPVPQDTSGFLGGITLLEELRRIVSEAWDKVCDKDGLTIPEKPKEVRAKDQRSTGRELDTRQPRLATEEDVPTDKKIRKRAEDAAADQVKHGDDSCSAKRVHAGSTSSTSFGMKMERPVLPCRDDIMDNKGAAGP